MPIESITVIPPASESLAEMLDPKTTALMVIDIQRDFAAPDGAMAEAGLDLSGVGGTIDQAERLIASARSVGATLVFARVVTTAETDAPNLKALYRRKGYGEAAVGICRAGASGADYYRVRPLPGEVEVQKTLFSSFVGTDLEDQLHERGVQSLVFVGLTTDCCVDCTVRDAFHRGFHCFVVEDACSAYDEGLHKGSLAAMANNVALVLGADQVAQAWAA